MTRTPRNLLMEEDMMYPWMMQPPNVVEQIKQLDDYKKVLLQQLKDEEEAKKKKSPQKKDSKGLGFFEGLVVAYIAQLLYGPVTKLIAFWLASHGVQ